MSSLHEWQRDFMQALTGDAPTLPQHLGVIDGYPNVAGERLAIYRNNWRSNLTQALRLVYPVVERLVGREFFHYSAQCFIATQPSHSANLDDYGAEFAAFLHGFAPAATLPYLGDVAALEAAIEIVNAAYDEATHLRVDSNFPLLKIWQCNQPGWSGADTINLEEGADCLLVRREHGEVVIEVLDNSNSTRSQ